MSPLADWLKKVRSDRRLLAGLLLSAAVLAVCSALTVRQNSFWRKPIPFYERILEHNPESIFAHANLAEEYSRRGRVDKALAHARSLIVLRPARGYFAVGTVYYKAGRMPEAIEWYRRATEEDPSNFRAFDAMGCAFDNLGKSLEAIEAFRKALEIDPTRGGVHNNPAVAAYQAGLFDLAVEHCDRALDLGFPVHPAFLKALQPHRKGPRR